MVIGLQNNSYTFEEEERNAEVCIQVIYPRIDIPVGFRFSVKFISTDDTASKYLVVYLLGMYVCTTTDHFIPMQREVKITTFIIVLPSILVKLSNAKGYT